jgi:hypothetical protein
MDAILPSAVQRAGRRLSAPVRALVPTSHLEDDHQSSLVVDGVDDPEIPDAETPPVAVNEP